MGRPRRVRFDTFKDYTLLHTEKIKMYCGTQITALYPVKETNFYYRSIEVWASYCSMFRHKKPFTLSLNIPTLQDDKAINFLNEHCWRNWVIENNKPSMKESIALLSNLFPNKKLLYFYELDSIIGAFCSGSFVSYDEKGNKESINEHQLKQRRYYTRKYNDVIHTVTPEIEAAYNNYRINADKPDAIKQKYFKIYYDLKEEYAYNNFNLDSVFTNIGENSVCYPVAFSDISYKSSYQHAGEIYFINTPNTVFFEYKRHY